MSNQTLDDRYFEWLYSLVASTRNRNPSRSYRRLIKCLYSVPFSWSVPNDDNRIGDARELRFEYLQSGPTSVHEDAWAAGECSTLEVLIALARRASFESFGTPGDWFWKFLQNLDLKGYTDSVYSRKIESEVVHTLHRVINRTYNASGLGGLFPLRNARKDQRRVELWYQLSAFLLEGDYIDHGP